MSDPQVSFQYEPTKQDRIMGRPNANGFVRSEPVPGCDASLQLPGARDSEILILDHRPDLQLEPRYARQRSELARYPRRAKLGSPEEWPEEREMLEFFVMADGHPDLGSLYFFVIVSLKPGQYHVEMSSALYGNTGDASPPGNTPEPWAKESGCKIPVDTGWLKVPILPQSFRRK
jgi:hypothetical protein